MIRSICLSSLLLLTPAAQADEKTELKLETVNQKASYAIGMNIGRQMARDELEIDVKALTAGMSDILAGKDSRLNEEELQAAMEAFQEILRTKAAERAKVEMAAAKAAAKVNAEAAVKFLAENGKKDGVKTTKSGLQYLVLSEGTGARPTKESTVSAHYRGKLLSGEVFDQSYEGKTPIVEDEPVPFPLNGVIAGWTEGLQLMKAGTSCRLFIPADLAYGEAGRPGIPPNSLLIFDIVLVSVE